VERKQPYRKDTWLTCTSW